MAPIAFQLMCGLLEDDDDDVEEEPPEDELEVAVAPLPKESEVEPGVADVVIGMPNSSVVGVGVAGLLSA